MALIDDLTEAMKLTSICGLGQFAHAPITSVLQHFREEIEAHILRTSLSGRCLPDARGAEAYERRPSN